MGIFSSCVSCYFFLEKKVAKNSRSLSFFYAPKATKNLNKINSPLVFVFYFWALWLLFILFLLNVLVRLIHNFVFNDFW